MDPAGLDAYKPAEIAQKVEEAGRAKASLGFWPLLTLAVLAGAFIAFGGIFYTVVTIGADPVTGPLRLMGGAAFSLGLILVVVGGAELFTGNALIVMGWADGAVSARGLLRNWGIVLIGNLAGALLIVLAMKLSGLIVGDHAARAAQIAEAKLALSPVAAFVRGALCNALVCLAVWLSIGARTVSGKILAILWPITAFVAIGFEHSVANFYLIPIGMVAGVATDASHILTTQIPVLIGNVLGGAGGVALSYRVAYSEALQKYRNR